jgi:hypothetical protein
MGRLVVSFMRQLVVDVGFRRSVVALASRVSMSACQTKTNGTDAHCVL